MTAILNGDKSSPEEGGPPASHHDKENVKDFFFIFTKYLPHVRFLFFTL